MSWTAMRTRSSVHPVRALQIAPIWDLAVAHAPAFAMGIAVSLGAFTVAHVLGQLAMLLVAAVQAILSSCFEALHNSPSFRLITGRYETGDVHLRRQLASEHEIAVNARAELEGVRGRIGQLEDEVRASSAAAEHASAAHEAEVRDMNGAISQAVRKLAIMDELLAALNGRLKSEQARARELEAVSASLRIELAHAADAKARTESAAAHARQVGEEAKAQAGHLSQELAKAQSDLSRAMEERAQLRSKLGEAWTQAQLLQGTVKQDRSQLQQRLSSLEMELAETRLALDQSREQLADAVASQQDISASMGVAEGSLEEVQAALSATKGELTAAKAALGDVNNAKLTLQAQLKASEVQNEVLSGEVDKLSAQLADAREAEKKKVAASKGLSEELGGAKQALISAQEDVRQLEAALASAEQAATTRLEDVHSEIQHLQGRLENANRDVVAAQEVVHEVQSEVADVMVHVLTQAMDVSDEELRLALEGSARATNFLKPGEVSMWALTTNELQTRLVSKKQELSQLEEQERRSLENLSEGAQTEHSQMLRGLTEIQQRQKGLAMMKIPEQRAERDAELQAEERAQRDRITAFLKKALPGRAARGLARVHADAQRVRDELSVLTRAAAVPLKERLQQLLVRQVATLRGILREEIVRLEDSSMARIAAKKAEIDASTKASVKRAAAAAKRQEEEVTAKSREEQAHVQQLRRAVAEERAMLVCEEQRVATERAALAKSKDYVNDLLSAHGPLEMVGSKEAALAQRQAALNEREAQVASREVESRRALEKAAAQTDHVALELAKLARVQEQVAEQQGSIAQREAAVAEELRQAQEQREALRGAHADVERWERDTKAASEREQAMLESLLAERKRQVEEEVAQLRTLAQVEADSQREKIRQERMTVVAQKAEMENRLQGADTEAKRYKDQIAVLRQRIETQFTASKQELEAAHAENRQLRHQLTGNAGASPDALSRPAKAGRSTGAEESEIGSKGSSDGSSEQEVSAWASHLLSSLSHGQWESGQPEAQQAAASAQPADADSVVPAAITEKTTPSLVGTRPPQQLIAAGVSVPHPGKKDKGGEDAFFVLDGTAIGVADGVGAWARDGIDPAEYSNKLMGATAHVLMRNRQSITCVQALQHAQDVVKLPGSSTAVVARLTPEGQLEVANLGDSGVRIIRDGRVIFATETLQHQFNMPYQLGCPELLPVTDHADNAAVYYPDVHRLDIVVMASDGLFDNMWDEDLATKVAQHAPAGGENSVKLLQELANSIARSAAVNSQDPTFRSPWSVACANSGRVNLLQKLFPKGGKLDDITVVVAQLL